MQQGKSVTRYSVEMFVLVKSGLVFLHLQQGDGTRAASRLRWHASAARMYVPMIRCQAEERRVHACRSSGSAASKQQKQYNDSMATAVVGPLAL